MMFIITQILFVIIISDPHRNHDEMNHLLPNTDPNPDGVSDSNCNPDQDPFPYRNPNSTLILLRILIWISAGSWR